MSDGISDGERSSSSFLDVGHQKHYTAMTIEPIIVLMNDLPAAEFRGFLKGNVLKYMLRADRKGGLEDYRKGLQYLKWLIEFEETGAIII